MGGGDDIELNKNKNRIIKIVYQMMLVLKAVLEENKRLYVLYYAIWQ